MKKYVIFLSLLLALSACVPQQASPDSQQASSQKAAQGFLLLESSRSSDAVKLFDEAISHDGRNMRAYQGKGIALAEQGKFTEAESVYKTALAIEPDSIPIINNLGLTYILQSNYDSAILLLTPYAKKEPIHAKIIENLALAHCLNGDETEAKKLYKNRLKGKELSDNLAFCKTFERIRKS